MGILACKVSIASPECLGTLLLGSVAHQLLGSHPASHHRVTGANLLFLLGPKTQLTEDWYPQRDCSLQARKCWAPGSEVGGEAYIFQVVHCQSGDSCHHALPSDTTLSLLALLLVPSCAPYRPQQRETTLLSPGLSALVANLGRGWWDRGRQDKGGWSQGTGTRRQLRAMPGSRVRLQGAHVGSTFPSDLNYKTEIKQNEEFHDSDLRALSPKPGAWTAARVPGLRSQPALKYGPRTPSIVVQDERAGAPGTWQQFESLITRFYLSVLFIRVPGPFKNLVCHPCLSQLSLFIPVCHYLVIWL